MMTINSRQIIIFYYLAISLFVLFYSCKNPVYNWDLLGYLASTKAFETDDIKEIHTFTYEQARKGMPRSNFEDLLGVEGDYRNTLYNDSLSLSLQLPLYRIRLFYVTIIFLLYKAGVNIVFATYFISAVSISLAIWTLFLIGKELRLAVPFMIILPPLALSYGVLYIAGLSTPDALLFFGFILTAYLFIKKRAQVLLVVPLLAAVRTDAILFSVPFLLYLIVFVKERKILAMFALLATLTIYWYVNWYCKNWGWSTIFYFTFITKGTPYFTFVDKISIKDYLNALIDGARTAVNDRLFLVFVGVSVFGGILSAVKSHFKKTDAFPLSEICVLFILSCLYVIAHFLLFPTVEHRFFMAQDVIVTIALFEVLSSYMSARLGRC